MPPMCLRQSVAVSHSSPQSHQFIGIEGEQKCREHQKVGEASRPAYCEDGEHEPKKDASDVAHEYPRAWKIRLLGRIRGLAGGVNCQRFHAVQRTRSLTDEFTEENTEKRLSLKHFSVLSPCFFLPGLCIFVANLPE